MTELERWTVELDSLGKGMLTDEMVEVVDAEEARDEYERLISKAKSVLAEWRREREG